ncbi:MAG TPA: hypothetical protein VLB90_07865 [Pseudomonadales bacterium]|nr:hypothetical protein [Pseudomonadales bacterium]
MIRYFLLLAIACISWYGSNALDNQLVRWRIEPQPPSSAPIVAELQNTPMPANAIELQDINTRLGELGQTALLESINLYSRYQVLAHILGLQPDAVPTVGATRAWANQYPDRMDQLTQDVLAKSIAVELAAADFSPPIAGRDGRNFNLAFSALGDGVWQEMGTDGSASLATARQLYFVVNVRNQLTETSLQSFDFYPVLVDKDEKTVPLPLPEHSYFWCSYQSMSATPHALAAGNSMPLLCEVRGGGVEPLQASSVVTILNDIRNGALHFKVWTKQLELTLPDSPLFSALQLRDNMVSAEFNHDPSEKTSTVFIASATPQTLVTHLTSCEERGDCLKTRLAPFEGLVSLIHIMLTGTIPGIIIAALVQAITRAGVSRNKSLAVMVVLTLLAFPLAFSLGGSGWGPLAAVIITAYLAAGFWIGVILGLFCLQCSFSRTASPT